MRFDAKHKICNVTIHSQHKKKSKVKHMCTRFDAKYQNQAF